MTVELTIRDGDPVYLSPDIWVVPGNDPNAEPGPPIANTPNFIWARVANRGTTAVESATVKYYWGNPATYLTRANMTAVGTSYVSLAPDESKEVLCVTPWVPTWVNDGHECLIVETYCAGDPLPPHTESSPFEVGANRQIAQLNLVLLMPLGEDQVVSFAFSASTPAKTHLKDWRLVVTRCPVARTKGLERQLGRLALKDLGEEVEFGLQPYATGQPLREKGRKQINLRLRHAEQEGFAFTARFPGGGSGRGGLFLIEEHAGGALAGGIGIVVEGRTPRGGEE
jgi:hypothetical protein